MTEQNDDNEENVLLPDDTDINIDKFISFIQKIDRRIDLKMIIIFLLFIMVAIMYFYYQKDITACNEYYKELIEQQNFLDFF